MKYRVFIAIILFWIVHEWSASPYFSPDHTFPTANQSQNACYFNSVNIAIEAKYGTKFRIKKVLGMIEFDGKSLATWEYKKRFSDLTHIQIREYSTKKEFIKLLDIGEPVLISTEIRLKSNKLVRHVSVAYSYDDNGIWVSDPLWWKRKRLNWSEVFWRNQKVKYYKLRTVSIKPYINWNSHSKEREGREDIWVDEKKLK